MATGAGETAPAAPDSQDQMTFYPEGNPAFIFKADGSGFAYYTSGKEPFVPYSGHSIDVIQPATV
jgi:hypothetical protein